MEARFVGLTESTDAFTVIADIIDGDFDDVEDTWFDAPKLIFEWSDFKDIIAKKDLEIIHWTTYSKPSLFYQLLHPTWNVWKERY